MSRIDEIKQRWWGPRDDDEVEVAAVREDIAWLLERTQSLETEIVAQRENEQTETGNDLSHRLHDIADEYDTRPTGQREPKA